MIRRGSRVISIGSDPASGVFTPTVFAVLNISTVTALPCYWTRIGNLVFMTGSVILNPVAAGASQIGISIPVPSGFFVDEHAAGVGASSAGEAGHIIAQTADNRLSLYFVAIDVAAHQMSFTASYLVL